MSGGETHIEISIHAPRVGSDALACHINEGREISIHAPRVGSDVLHIEGEGQAVISIHAPRVGSDIRRHARYHARDRFQSTLPAWGATTICRRRDSAALFQSTLPAWGATTWCASISDSRRFQSTLPAWGATKAASSDQLDHGISIHAPRVGSDSARACPTRRTRYFNPRSPRGERPWLMTGKGINGIFQSTLPAWGATSSRDSHLPSCSGFQSTLPAWGATADPHRRLGSRMISIHAPRVGSDVSLSS